MQTKTEAKDAEIDRLLHAQFAGDLERRVAAAGFAGSSEEEPEPAIIGGGVLQFGLGAVYGVVLGCGGTLALQWVLS